jgi:hypothetical protein
MNGLTKFFDIAEVLIANGYAPIAMPRGKAQPEGAWAVMQMAWHTPTNGKALAAILTAVAPPRNEQSPIQRWRESRLTTVEMRVRPGFVDEADAMMIERGARIVRVSQDGARVWVFRNGGEPFSALASRPYKAGTMRVQSARHFLALTEDVDGTAFAWPHGTPVDVRRDELPVLNAGDAQRLIAAFETWANEREPAPVLTTPHVPKPLLEPGERLSYGNLRARLLLERGGFHAVPVKPAASTAPGSVDAHDMGVALNPSGTGGAGRLALVTISSRSAAVAEQLAKLGHPDQTGKILAALGELISAHYAAPYRRLADGSWLFVFRNDDHTAPLITKGLSALSVAGAETPGTGIRLTIATRDSVVPISDEWSVDWFKLKRAELPTLSENLVSTFMRPIEEFFAAGAGLREPTRRKRATRKASAA